jgi:hypothetical protein
MTIPGAGAGAHVMRAGRWLGERSAAPSLILQEQEQGYVNAHRLQGADTRSSSCIALRLRLPLET